MAKSELPIYEAHVRGRIHIHELSAETRHALISLKQALAREPWLEHAQVTLDHVRVFDNPGIKVDLIKRLPHTELQLESDRARYESIIADVNWTKFYVD